MRANKAPRTQKQRSSKSDDQGSVVGLRTIRTILPSAAPLGEAFVRFRGVCAIGVRDRRRERLRARFTLRSRSLPLAVQIQRAFPYTQLKNYPVLKPEENSNSVLS